MKTGSKGRLSTREVIKKYDVINRAITDAQSGSPTKHDKEPNETQVVVENDYRDAAQGIYIEASKKVNDIRNKLTDGIFDTAYDKAIGFEAAIVTKVKQIVGDEKTSISKLGKNLNQMQVAFRGFVARNPPVKNKIPRYPESQILHWSILILLVVVESIANAYFFAQASDFGLLGGFLQAVFVSIANIVPAAYAGVGFRFRNCTQDKRQYLGWCILVFYTILMQLLNLIVAHYRALVEINPDVVFQEVWNAVTGHIYMIQSLDATLLLIFGSCFSIGAFWKAYLSDDTYPGLGEAHRAKELADKEFQSLERQLRDDVKKALNSAREDLEASVNQCRRICRTYPKYIKDAEHIKAKCEKELSKNDGDCRAVLKAYRDENARVRLSTNPPYWEDYPDFSAEFDIDDLDLSTDELDTKQRLEDRLKAVECEYEKKLKGFNDISETAFTELDSLIAMHRQEDSDDIN